jgi:acetoin utilization deacetylase AcuC-like enzyme
MALLIIYSPRFEERYPTNPVESPDRVSLPARLLQSKGYGFIEPQPAKEEDILSVHGRSHLEMVKARGLFEAAGLAAGGAICAAERAAEGEPAFALIRPPGHHASANRSWGLCFFNNMAIAVQKIRRRAGRILIIDIDLHFGDGTVSIFRGDGKVRIVNPGSVDPQFDYIRLDCSSYLRQVEAAFERFEGDMVAVSAGFDTYIEDWGGLLKTGDYEKIGRIIKRGSESCQGRRFAVLEGGYHPHLRYNIDRFIKGFS